jgi:hypothetical protein
MIPVMVFLLFLLIEPYYVVSKLYGFFRPWIVINELLPRLGSYFIADNSLIWGALSTNLQGIPARWEHQLFPGLTIIVLVIIGLIFRPKSQNQGIAWLSFWAALVLIGITLSFRGYSFYSLIWFLPGLNSIRAVTRIVLVLMWPGAVFITYVLDSFVRFEQGGRHNYGRYWFACTIVVVLLVETFVYHHSTISKVDAQNRLVASNNMIPSAIPQNPILFIASKETEPQFISDIDAMLVAQDRGWPTLNGYSGNFPGNYGIAATCLALPERIISYMKFAQISDEEYYSEMVKRVVLVGFTDCDPDGRIKIP